MGFIFAQHIQTNLCLFFTDHYWECHWPTVFWKAKLGFQLQLYNLCLFSAGFLD